MNKIARVLTVGTIAVIMAGCSAIQASVFMPLEHVIDPRYKNGNGGFSETPPNYTGYVTVLHPDGRKEVIHIK